MVGEIVAIQQALGVFLRLKAAITVVNSFTNSPITTGESK
jgi:hypothetical protein